MILEHDNMIIALRRLKKLHGFWIEHAPHATHNTELLNEVKGATLLTTDSAAVSTNSNSKLIEDTEVEDI